VTPLLDRGLIGKEFPPFTIAVTEDLSEEFSSIIRIPGGESVPSRPPPSIWPAVMTFRATACLIPVWEDLGADPLAVRLIREEFLHERTPDPGEELRGRVRIGEITEEVEPDGAIEDQADLVVDFTDSSGGLVASYRCRYRIPVAVTRRNDSD
jgi:hypothetical protein